VSKSTGSNLAIAASVLAIAVVVVLWQSVSSSRERGRSDDSAANQAAAAARQVPPRLLPPPPPPAAPPTTVPVPVGAASVDALPAESHRPLGEAALMAELRKARQAGQHGRAISLAREGNRRFPDSTFAPERHSILIHSLADNEQRTEARGEAEQMVNHYPDSDWVREIERFTGAHRHRNVRLNDAGEIEYY
jgi:hypothetical protein